MLTAVPVVACLLQYLDGSCRRPGLWCQANIVDPERLLRDIERLGVAVQIDVQPKQTEPSTQGNNAMTPKHKWNELTPIQQATIAGVGLFQVLLLIAALVDLRRRPAAQINGSKKLWTLAAFINFVGPISYFLFGRKRSK